MPPCQMLACRAGISAGGQWQDITASQLVAIRNLDSGEPQLCRLFRPVGGKALHKIPVKACLDKAPTAEAQASPLPVKPGLGLKKI